MLIRKLKSKNGKTYVQEIYKCSGKYKVAKSFGGSDNQEKLQQLLIRAKVWIQQTSGIKEHHFDNSDQIIERFIESIYLLSFNSLILKSFLVFVQYHVLCYSF
jgi:hypothetical protein